MSIFTGLRHDAKERINAWPLVSYWYHAAGANRSDDLAVSFVLGIDGGGTGCRAALADETGAVLGHGASGPANIMTDFAGAFDNILEAARLAAEAAGLSSDAFGGIDAVLGLAGSNVGDTKAMLLQRLPFRRSLVESDGLIALEGALGTNDGAIAIVGTGSIFTARRAGRLRTIGGWGFLLGDWGGGARIGKRLLEEALLAHDDIRAGSGVTDAVLAHFGGDPRAFSQWAATAKPRDYGTFAPLVFTHAADGDATAKRILGEAAADLDEAIRALKLIEGERLCLLGGLAPLMAPLLGQEAQKFLHPPLGDALSGALALGFRHFAEKLA